MKKQNNIAFGIHTDLAIDLLPHVEQKGYKVAEEVIDKIKITSVDISKKSASSFNKKEGTYITIEFEDGTDSESKDNLINIVSKKIRDILNITKIKETDICLIIGLGNEKSTPDALGPLSLNNILVTNHLYLLGVLEKGYRRVSAISPSVMGETGIETSDIITSVVKQTKPDFVIVIDALASTSITRLNKTIQISNTGIHPGSGIGNKRKEISLETIGVPVIALGIPTVVDAVTIVSDTIDYISKHYSFTKGNINNPSYKLVSGNINYLKKDIKEDPLDRKFLLGKIGELTSDEVRSLVFEVLNPINYNLMVTPKEVDFQIKELSEIIAASINKALHSNTTNYSK